MRIGKIEPLPESQTRVQGRIRNGQIRLAVVVGANQAAIDIARGVARQAGRGAVGTVNRNKRGNRRRSAAVRGSVVGEPTFQTVLVVQFVLGCLPSNRYPARQSVSARAPVAPSKSSAARRLIRKQLTF